MNVKCIPRSESSHEDSRDALPALRGLFAMHLLHAPLILSATHSSKLTSSAFYISLAAASAPVTRDRCG